MLICRALGKLIRSVRNLGVFYLFNDAVTGSE
jgi:hypothetical protein